MKEQLISFETAKLAREKGFNEPINRIIGISYYNYLGELNGDSLIALKHRKDKSNKYKNIVAPTQSLLQKWLREIHKICVEPTLNFTNDEFPLQYNCGVMYNIDSMSDFKWLGCECSYSFYKAYEEALEAGLQEALKLIE